jgi:hypothetical protein
VHGFVQTVSPGNEVVRVRRDAGTGAIVFPEASGSKEQALSAIRSEIPWPLDTSLPQSGADSSVLKGLRLRGAEKREPTFSDWLFSCGGGVLRGVAARFFFVVLPIREQRGGLATRHVYAPLDMKRRSSQCKCGDVD